MRLSGFCGFLLGHFLLAAAESHNVPVYIQGVGSLSPPTRLADVNYDTSTLQASLISFEPPDLGPESRLARVGIYDPAKSTWLSSTSLTSIDNFTKGYALTLLLAIDNENNIIGVACKGSKIDAGQTRDFGPKVKLSIAPKAKHPELNKPVVLSAEGKLSEDVPEKTFLQKYWWAIGLGLLMLTVSG